MQNQLEFLDKYSVLQVNEVHPTRAVAHPPLSRGGLGRGYKCTSYR